MSIRVKTQPVEPIAVSGASSIAAPEVSADIFRGVFIELVDNGNVRDINWLNTQPNGTKSHLVNYRGTSNPNEFGVSVGGGLYGDDCFATICRNIPVTFDYLTNDSLVTSVGHGLAENATVIVREYPLTGSLPTGMVVNAGDPFEYDQPHRLINVTADTFEISNQFGFTASNSGGDLLLSRYNSAAHGFQVDNKIRIISNNPPAPIVSGTDYWVIADGLTSSSLKLSTEQGGAPLPYSTAGSYGQFMFRSDKGMSYTSNGVGQCAISDTGIPDFHILRGYIFSGPGTANYYNSGNDQFTGPVSGRPYNRFEFWFKPPVGFRAEYIANGDPIYTIHFGTFHCPLNSDKAETNNYHFYLEAVQRSDLSAGEWIRCKFNPKPTHQRDSSGLDPGNEPTPAVGASFFSSMSRLYLAGVAYGSHAEIYGEYSVPFDRIRIYYEDDPHPLTLTWDSHDKTQMLYVPYGVNTDTAFTITNTGATPVTGKLRQLIGQSLSAQILDSSFSVVGTNDDVTVPASGTWQGYLRLTSASTVGGGNTYVGTVNFIPNDQFNPVGTNESNFSDSNLEVKYSAVRSGLNLGPFDGAVYSDSFQPMRVLLCTFDESTDTVSCSSHTFAENETVQFYAATGAALPSEIASGTTYYTRDVSAGVSFRLSATSLGSLHDFTDNGSGSLYVRT